MADCFHGVELSVTQKWDSIKVNFEPILAPQPNLAEVNGDELRNWKEVLAHGVWWPQRVSFRPAVFYLCPGEFPFFGMRESLFDRIH